MGLPNYGVLLGSPAGFRRDDPANPGKFYHGFVDISVNGVLNTCAVDVDTKKETIHIDWKIVHLRVEEWKNIFELPDGFHTLASNPTTGAVDYMRDTRLNRFIFIPEIIDGPWPPPWFPPIPPIPRIPIWTRIQSAFQILAGTPPVLEMPRMQMLTRKGKVVPLPSPWKKGTGLQALDDLEAVVKNAKRVVIFGQRFESQQGKPAGMHNIHQNQGDPAGSQWFDDNAIWQDGLTVAINADGSASAFMNKFSSQATKTDDQGHPIP